MGDLLKAALGDRLRGSPAVTEVRGLGLMIGVELATPELARRGRPRSASSAACWCSSAASKTIRFSPPLIINEAQARTIAELFAAVCKEASAPA